MSNVGLGWNNYVTRADTVLVTSSAESNLPVDNLKSDQGSPSMGWQTHAGDDAACNLRVTPVTPGLTWRAAGLFRTNLTPQSLIGITLSLADGTVVYNTGWLQLVSAGFGQAVFVFPQDYVADNCFFQFRDGGNPDNFINCALAYCGPLFMPLTGLGFSSAMGRDEGTDEVVSRGGQLWPTNRWAARRWNIALDGIRTSEIWNGVDALDRFARQGSNALFVPNVTSVDSGKESIFGRVRPTADISYPYQAADRRSWRASITERL